jgi:hypothetical protein
MFNNFSNDELEETMMINVMQHRPSLLEEDKRMRPNLFRINV